jgi:hypothetical protein
VFAAHPEVNMSVLSLIWGILAIIGFMVAFLPCLGSLNWLNVPFSAAGLIFSIIALSKEPPHARGGATAGLILCAIAVIIGIARLWLGGGIL